jgi:hypothetical protein
MMNKNILTTYAGLNSKINFDLSLKQKLGFKNLGNIAKY